MLSLYRRSQPAPLVSLPDPDPADVDRMAVEAARAAHEGRHDHALRTYQAALLADEGRADLWYHYGNLQRGIGLVHDAIDSFECALRIDDTMYTARYRLARLLHEMNQRLQAAEHFRVVTEQRPSYLPAWRALVQVTLDLGKTPLAELYVRDALRQARDGDEVLDALLAAIVARRRRPA